MPNFHVIYTCHTRSHITRTQCLMSSIIIKKAYSAYNSDFDGLGGYSLGCESGISFAELWLHLKLRLAFSIKQYVPFKEHFGGVIVIKF